MYLIRSVIEFNNLTKSLVAEISSMVSLVKQLERNNIVDNGAVIESATELEDDKSSAQAGQPFNHKLSEFSLKLNYLKEVLIPCLNLMMGDVMGCMSSGVADEQCKIKLATEELLRAAISTLESCVPMLDNIDTDLFEAQGNLKLLAQRFKEIRGH